MITNHPALLNLLKIQQKPVGLGVLKAQLSTPERTLRRWLSQLVQEGTVIAIGVGKGRKYQILEPAVEKVFSVQESHPIFSEKSAHLLAQVHAPLMMRQPCAYHEDWLNAYIPNQTFYLNKTQRQLLYQNGKRVSQELPAGTYAHKIFNRLLIDLSYNSSRLEGNTYSILQTEKLILEGKFALDKLDAESMMIINHKEAIKFLVDGINRMEINVDNIRTLHYLLADGLVPPGSAGIVRDDGVRISATTYMPIEGTARLEKLLEKIAYKASQIEDPFEQSFFLLVHLSYLQAFIDVNKRTSRLAANIPLVQHNLVPLSFNDMSKDDYISAMLVIYELNDVMPLAELYIWSYLRTCKQYTVTAQTLGIEPVRVFYRAQRRQLIADIVHNLICEPELSAFIAKRTKEMIPIEHHAKFIEHVRNDLAELAPYTIAGMGISVEELEKWKKHYKRSL
jgi:prophage maintenance system killer protein